MVYSRGHALVARDLLQALPNDRFGELNSDLKQIVEVMLKDAKTLRCHRAGVISDNSFEQFVNLIFDDSIIVAHWIEQSVVAMMAPIATTKNAYSHVAAFVGSQGDALQINNGANKQQIPLEILGDLRQAATRMDFTEFKRWLQGHLKGDWVHALASTLTDTDVIWGDVLRIERQSTGITAEKGFLFASAKGVVWLFIQDHLDTTHITIIPGFFDRISECCKEVLL